MSRTQPSASTSQTLDTQDAPDFTEEQITSCRIKFMYQDVATSVLQYIFREGLSKGGKMQEESLLDYFGRCSVNVNKFHKDLNPDQKKKVSEDHDGKTYDITLLHKCFRLGAHVFGCSSNDKWKDFDSLLTRIKAKRNEIAHGTLYTRNELYPEAKTLKENLTKILEVTKDLKIITDGSKQQGINSAEDGIKKCLTGDFQQKTLEVYKQQVEFVNTEGSKELRDGFEKCSEHQVSPVNHIVQIDPIPLDEIYTDIRMEGNDPVEYKDILLDEKNQKGQTESVIVINAQAGAGKTTLTKKITLDWKEKNSDMKFLVEHNLLLKTEGRSRSAGTIGELIAFLIPETSKYLKIFDLRNIIFDQKVLVVFDGLDELNSRSKNLFQELLELKKRQDFSLLVTTRPEKIMYLKKQLSQHSLRMKHLQLVGVPLNKISELCSKYYNAMCKKSTNPPEVTGLLNHLTEAPPELADLWKIPYNLILITMLYLFRDGDITSIRTSPRLHMEICHLYTEKLKERLSLSETIKCLSDTDVDATIKHFVYVLARESLVALKDDNISIPKASYDQLIRVCCYYNLDIDEMAGAFLLCLSTAQNSDKVYVYPHKGTQDFFGALYVWLKLTNQDYDMKEFMKKVAVMARADGIPYQVIEDFHRSTTDYLTTRHDHSVEFEGSDMHPQQSTSTNSGAERGAKRLQTNHDPQKKVTSSYVKKILEGVGIQTTSDLSKYSNVLKHVIGMFFLEKDKVKEEHKEEVLILLEKTGTSRSNDWIDLLNSVECDDYVVTFISRQPNIFDDFTITIEDHSLQACIKLLNAFVQPSARNKRCGFAINLKHCMKEVAKAIELINYHGFKISTFYIDDDNVRDFLTMMKENPQINFSPEDLGIRILKSLNLDAIRELLNMCRSPSVRRISTLVIDCLFRMEESLDLDSKKALVDTLKRHSKHIEFYIGPMSPAIPSLPLEKKIRVLMLNVSSTEDLSNVVTSVERNIKKHGIVYLGLCLNLDKLMDSSIEELSARINVFLFLLFLPEVSEANLNKAVEVSKHLSSGTSLKFLLFPRLTAPVLNVLKRFTESGVSVRQMVFPTNAKEEIPKEISDTLTFEVMWGKGCYDVTDSSVFNLDTW